MGALGERLYDRMLASHARVFDANGTLVAEGRAGVIVEGVLPRTRHRFEVTGPGSLFTASVDPAKEDTFLPKLTGLRIVDENGRQLSIVDRQSRPALLFSVADEINQDIWRWRVPPRESATFAEYRPHGTEEWRPLPAVVTVRHYDNNFVFFGGVGTVFRADLTDVITQHPGPIDLRLRSEDETGNTIELVLTPAFRSTDHGPRRRSARH